ncbi:tetraspanin-5-like isoform X3 [Syngnathoides biaculeatus]|uniref:tetraspanin-5-like isoform X3 n=1 Tax=Syngnathoides biaculeatus TaxID=300417 RepID=UPI002ADD705C|nr:tetraspanin-5-like isoform X3 [Syngnathoides biaculeatus]
MGTRQETDTTAPSAGHLSHHTPNAVFLTSDFHNVCSLTPFLLLLLPSPRGSLHLPLLGYNSSLVWVFPVSCCVRLLQGVLSNISSITDLGGLDPVWLFMVVGGVMFILGFAGCIGALRENTFLLKFFSVFLGIIFFLELTTGILAFVFKDWIKDQLNLFINNNIRAYRDDIDLQNLIDFTQEYWECCGAFGADDWNLNIYFNCTDANPSREKCGVPFSCCTKDPAEDVINTQCGYDVREKSWLLTWTRGLHEDANEGDIHPHY